MTAFLQFTADSFAEVGKLFDRAGAMLMPQDELRYRAYAAVADLTAKALAMVAAVWLFVALARAS